MKPAAGVAASMHTRDDAQCISAFVPNEEEAVRETVNESVANRERGVAMSRRKALRRRTHQFDRTLNRIEEAASQPGRPVLIPLKRLFDVGLCFRPDGEESGHLSGRLDSMRARTSVQEAPSFGSRR